MRLHKNTKRVLAKPEKCFYSFNSARKKSSFARWGMKVSNSYKYKNKHNKSIVLVDQHAYRKE